MKILLTLAGVYVAIGIFECMTATDGQAGCPIVGPCTIPVVCSNKSLSCVLMWPVWNYRSCNIHPPMG